MRAVPANIMQIRLELCYLNAETLRRVWGPAVGGTCDRVLRPCGRRAGTSGASVILLQNILLVRWWPCIANLQTFTQCCLLPRYVTIHVVADTMHELDDVSRLLCQLTVAMHVLSDNHELVNVCLPMLVAACRAAPSCSRLPRPVPCCDETSTNSMHCLASGAEQHVKPMQMFMQTSIERSPEALRIASLGHLMVSCRRTALTQQTHQACQAGQMSPAMLPAGDAPSLVP